MGSILAVVNQKGGVGKTTTAVNLTAALTEIGKHVLLCDFDPQANATSGLGIEKRTLKRSVYDVVINGTPAADAIVHTQFGDVLPATADLAGAGVELVGMERPNHRLGEALFPLKSSYDLILIDCPPSLELLTVNALAAADGILVPVQCEYYALEGVSSLMNTVNRVKHAFNPGLDIEGVLLTMLDGRTNLGLQVVDEVKKHFRKKVFATTIPRNVRLGEAPSHGEPIHLYDPRSTGAEAYRSLAREVLARNGK